MANRSPENEKALDVKLEWVPVQGPDGNRYISTDDGSMNDQILKAVPG